jgi:hypothetical protein
MAEIADSFILTTSDKLCLMRRRSHIWALGAFLVAIVLGFHGRTRETAVVETNSVTRQADHSVFPFSAALCEALRLQFHRCTQALLLKPISQEFRSVWIRQVAEFVGPPSDLFYSPIQRRPPPSFS